MAYWDEGYAQQSQQQGNLMQAIVAGIGGIVILLGALGLLTMSIVTVKNRVREIGIRRAVGAFGTTSIFRSFPRISSCNYGCRVCRGGAISDNDPNLAHAECEWIFTAEFSDIAATVAYPMSAALIGVGISATVGALCGIIPATIAVKMRPIDAIRF